MASLDDTAPLTAIARPAPPAAAASGFRLDPRYHTPLLITLVMICANGTLGILDSSGQILLAIGTAIGSEVLLSRVMGVPCPSLASSYMTGTSVGMLVRTTAYWPFALCSAISIMSKYVIRMNGRHVWNPSNFGVSFLLFWYPMYIAHLSVQWGNAWWSIAMVWGLASIVLTRLRLIHVSLTYVLAFLVLAGVRSAVTGHAYLSEIAPITGPMYQLFILFMITDPKTAVRTKRGRMATVVVVALVEALFRCLPTFFPASGLAQGLAIHAPFYALFVVGPAFLVCENLRDQAR